MIPYLLRSLVHARGRRPFGMTALAVALLVTVPRLAQAQTATPKYYYYDPDGVGAHAFYNPWNFIVQGGLGAMYDERIDDFGWAAGFRTVNRSLASPIDTISDYGWGRFLYREFLPHLGPGQNYVPNYVWHFTGGGMRTKLMEEYYTHLGLRKRPAAALAWLTMYSYHYLNEAVQAERFRGSRRATTDALADMYFFDWAGGLFFQFDVINRFMSGTLHQREWSFQAQYDLTNARLSNNGQLYWMRLPVYADLSLSFLTGEQITSLNLTYARGDRQFSAGVGPKSKSFIARKNGDTDPTEIVFCVGLYYSVRDNPMVTFTFEPEDPARRRSRADGRYLVNVYPGIVQAFGHRVAMSFAYKQGTILLGLALGALPGGVALSSR